MYLQVAVNIHIYHTLKYATPDETTEDHCSPDDNALGLIFSESTSYKNQNPDVLTAEKAPDRYPKIMVGCRVLVTVGSRELMGVVVSEHTKNELSRDNATQGNIKKILRFIDEVPIFDHNVISVLLWAASYYHYPVGEVFFSALPPLLKSCYPAKLPEIEGWEKTETAAPEKLLGRSCKAKEAWNCLQKQSLSTADFKNIGIPGTILKGLEKKGLLKRINLRERQKPWYQGEISVNHEFTMNEEQNSAVTEISAKSGFNVFLINGVTGSGKTEVYLNIIEKIIRKGLQAMVLVPEINLTPQTVKRFYRRFSVPIVCINSAMPAKERLNSFLLFSSGNAAILIGTRSAVFTPMRFPGIIIIDEEHDSSFRQEDGFRYHARDLATVRARMENIPIILGSATPSLESLYNVKIGKFHEIKLLRRAGNAQPAKIIPINMCREGQFHGISDSMLIAIRSELEQNNQVLIMLNRRGYAPKIICHDCGYIFLCSNCDSSLCYHQDRHILLCHHCETRYPVPSECPLCKSRNLTVTGNGTEQLESCLKNHFPNESIVRIDRDSITKKGVLEQYLQEINDKKHRIIIGTQMLAKGHDFPEVTLVGIINVDSSLISEDFRSREKLAQLIIQVSGRAGRATKKGRVLLQTYWPNHPLLELLIKEGYNAFASEELSRRERLKLPPITSHAVIRGSSPSHRSLSDLMDEIYFYLLEICTEYPHTKIHPPMAASMERKGNRYYLNIVIESDTRAELQKFLTSLIHHKNEIRRANNCRTVIDVDPSTTF
ncbi:primosomal protein N' [Succinimonas amylolytica]|uniref:primosomal protein N' n=1 Tax=Succinimonas amylolytica TaxID=83769 RepID=UPI0003708F11|nr:primosomal protein N' [Succinimonas amylolytica]